MTSVVLVVLAVLLAALVVMFGWIGVLTVSAILAAGAMLGWLSS